MLSIKDVILRPINEDDLEMVLGWRNSEYVRKFMLTDHIIKLDEHQKWFQNARSNPTCEWSIVEYKSTPVGVFSITEIKEKDGTCSWGMYIDEKFSNLGIGILIEINAIDRMINHHRIRKICGQALESNRILLTHKRFGFEEEGILKEHVIRNGKPEDVILIALFSEKWKEKREEMVEMLNLKDE